MKVLGNSINIEFEVSEDMDESQVVFKIIFVNQSDRRASISFSNESRTAERIGLNILDSGNRLEPAEFSIIKVASASSGEKEIDANSRYEYDLVASFEKPGVLKFPGASYLLKAGITYDICFKYQGVTSDVVSWSAPVWW